MGKILIVEDDETIRNGLMIMLTIQGYIVDCAVDGKDAVEKFDDSYNLVVMDVLMPRMSGIDACRKMRDISNVPILFLTAKSSEIDKIQGFDAGAYGTHRKNKSTYKTTGDLRPETYGRKTDE